MRGNSSGIQIGCHVVGQGCTMGIGQGAGCWRMNRWGRGDSQCPPLTLLTCPPCMPFARVLTLSSVLHLLTITNKRWHVKIGMVIFRTMIARFRGQPIICPRQPNLWLGLAVTRPLGHKAWPQRNDYVWAANCKFCWVSYCSKKVIAASSYKLTTVFKTFQTLSI